MRDPHNRRIGIAMLIKFVLLASLWCVFVKDATWTPGPDDVGNAFLSSAPSAGEPVREPAP